MAIYKNNNGTWYVMIRYQDWTGARKQKCKRGFATRKEAADWELQFKLQKKASLDMTMYYYLKDNQGNVKDFDTFLEKMYKDIFNETGTYANLRDYIRQFEIDKAEFHVLNLTEICELDRLLYHITPFLLSFKYDSVEQLCNNWKYIANRFLSYNTSNPAMEMLLIHGYTLLDMHPLIKKEKLKKKKNTLDNIIRDGSHCYYASKANYFVSEDEAIRDKMSFLYSAYDIKTKILSEQELLYRFSQRQDEYWINDLCQYVN